MQNQSTYRTRREELVKRIKAQYQDKQDGVVLLCSGFEQERGEFRQESSFYYLTGITEAGVFLIIDFSGKSTLYVPKYSAQRGQWVLGTITPESNPAHFGIEVIKYSGEALAGFSLSQLFSVQDISILIKDLEMLADKKRAVFTLKPNSQHHYIQQQIVVSRLEKMVSGLSELTIDMSSVVASMRRVKSKEEIDLLYKSVEYTMVAHSGVSQLIEEGKKESELQATIEYLFIEANGRPAFPSIIAGGKNGTILHYTKNNSSLKRGDLVVIDIGIDLDYYCADLSRTYPVSGSFSKRQKEVYNIVLSAQEYIAGIAKPGYWLNNKENPDKSLHHLALRFLTDRGYGKYFVHGIGHFLGLDVHDVGNSAEPLQAGDVITLEPGAYIPQENLAIRIEDNYVMAKEGLICISQDLPREIEDIEEMMREEYDEEDDGE